MAITKKQLMGYMKAHKEFISQNDAYNKQCFGITKDIYFKIHRAIVDIYGRHGQWEGNFPSLVAINKKIK